MTKAITYQQLVKNYHVYDYGMGFLEFVFHTIEKLRKQGIEPRQCSDRLHHQVENALLHEIKRKE